MIRSRFAAAVSVTALLVVAVVLFAIRNSGPDYAKVADAYLKMGALDSAQVFLERQIVREPQDIDARLKYAQVVLDQGDTARAERTLEAVRNDTEQRDSSRHRKAVSQLRSLVVAEAKWADSIATLLFKKQEYDSVPTYAYAAVEGYRRTGDLARAIGDTLFLDFLTRLNVSAALAKGIVATYLGADTATANALMRRAPVSVLDSALWQETASSAASTLDSIASAAFHAKRWHDSRRHYRLAKDFYRVSRDSAEQARMLYNAALTYWNQGQYLSARKLMTALRDSFPFYETAAVQQTIAKAAAVATTARHGREFERLEEKASSAWEEERWMQARQRYRELLELVIKGELDRSVDWILYNIAMTYYNEREYRRARDELQDLKYRFPHYKPGLVTDALRRVERLIP